MENPKEFDATYFENFSNSDAGLYKLVKTGETVQQVIFYLWTALIVIFLLFGVIHDFNVSRSEGLLGLVIRGIVLGIIYFIGLLIFRFCISIPIDFMIFRRAKKPLLASIPEEFDAGTIHLWSAAPGMLAVDYANRVFMTNIFSEKYEPYFVDADSINSVKVENKPEVTSETTIHNSGKLGKTKSKVEDNAYLQIHFQLPGQPPNWLSIPFKKDKIEAESVASALLNL